MINVIFKILVFFDFFDGLAARLLNAQSDVGLQFDSLADMVTSGLAPGIVMVQLLSQACYNEPFSITNAMSTPGWNTHVTGLIPLIGLLLVVASGYRLAKFNVDTRQTTSFIGLPTPANAILILSLPLILHFQNSELVEGIILNKWVLIAVTLLGSILLNIELFIMKLG